MWEARVCVYAGACVCACASMHVCACECVCACMCAYMCACVHVCVRAHVCARVQVRARAVAFLGTERLSFGKMKRPRRTMVAAQRCNCVKFHCSASQAARGARFKLGHMGSGDRGLGRWEAAGGHGRTSPSPLLWGHALCHRRRVAEGAGAAASGPPAGGAKRPPRRLSKALRGTRSALAPPRSEAGGGRAGVSPAPWKRCRRTNRELAAPHRRGDFSVLKMFFEKQEKLPNKYHSNVSAEAGRGGRSHTAGGTGQPDADL